MVTKVSLDRDRPGIEPVRNELFAQVHNPIVHHICNPIRRPTRPRLERGLADSDCEIPSTVIDTMIALAFDIHHDDHPSVSYVLNHDTAPATTTKARKLNGFRAFCVLVGW